MEKWNNALQFTGERMSRSFELQGHRGARGLFPENTLAGFGAAMALGVSSLELDVVMTADDILAVVHDPELNPDLTRGPDNNWLAPPGPAVRSLRWDELALFDVGAARPGGAVAQANPAQQSLERARIPSLEQVLDLVAGRVVIDIELKTDPNRPKLSPPPAKMAEAVVALARRRGGLDHLAIRSFDWRGLIHLRAHRPEIPLGWLTAPNTANATWRGEFVRPDLSIPASVALASGGNRRDCWAPFFGELNPNLIAEAHALGLRVVPWTVNAPGDMARLISWGVDGLCTDRPDIARQIIAEAGLDLPPPCAEMICQN